jgi:hypothetical protein
MGVAISQRASQTYTFAAGETDMTGHVEVKRTLPRPATSCTLFCFEGSERTGRREELRLRGIFIRRTIRIPVLVPHLTLEIL